MTPIFGVGIIGFIALFVYLAQTIPQEYDCFAQCIRDVRAFQDIFRISRCSFSEEGDYEFKFTHIILEKREAAAYFMFYSLYKGGAIFSLEEEGKAFVPQIHRDKFVIEMGTTLKAVLEQLEDYENTDALWQFLFRKQYNELKKLAPKFEEQYEAICSMEPGNVFCTPVEL